MHFIDLDRVTKDRYDMSKLIQWNEGCYDILDSYFWDMLKTVELSGRYVIQGEEHRPDLLAYNVYGDVQYWWILMLFNNLSCNEQLKTGMVIEYPSLQEVEKLYSRLATIEKVRG